MEKNLNNISKDKFEFVQHDSRIFDKAPETKPVGYFKDAWRRFKKNKASVVAAYIILALVLFSIVVPWIAPFPLDFSEGAYRNMKPKNLFSSAIVSTTATESTYEYHLGMSVGVNHFAAVGKTVKQAKDEGLFSNIAEGRENKYSPLIGRVVESVVVMPDGLEMRFTYQLDTYLEVGFRWESVSVDEYNDMKQWQEDNNKPLLYPVINLMADTDGRAVTNADLWYRQNGKERAVVGAGTGKVRGIYEEFEHNYRALNALGEQDSNNGVIQDWYPEGSTGNRRLVRVLTYNFFDYKYGKEPRFILGTDSGGRDMLIRLARGAQTSLLLGVAITAVCFAIGSVIGAVMGYYGGWTDLIGLNIMSIISGIPAIVALSLMRIRWIDAGILSAFGALVVYFALFGWLGDAGAMRNQFYRFKSQEYVLAARTLGARDRRIMFKHILPNSLGTIITGLALSIPGVIGMETTLAYLGIMRIDTGNRASIGAMLAEGQAHFTKYPHIIFWPALVLALLMISFNLFGNGLRDAFNPQLRGVED